LLAVIGFLFLVLAMNRDGFAPSEDKMPTGSLCLASTSITEHNGVENPLDISLDTNSQGGISELAVGECVVFSIRNPGAGGYRLQDPDYDPKIVRLKEQKRIPPIGSSAKGGDFGEVEYTFCAASPGTTDVVFRIFRSWEKTAGAQEILRVKVLVKR
jgi:predicted secreted protein